MSFFFTDPATTEIYTLSLHDALPIFERALGVRPLLTRAGGTMPVLATLLDRGVPTMLTGFGLLESNVHAPNEDRKSTRLNSSHGYISYAVFCLKKKKKKYRLKPQQHS